MAQTKYLSLLWLPDSFKILTKSIGPFLPSTHTHIHTAAHTIFVYNLSSQSSYIDSLKPIHELPKVNALLFLKNLVAFLSGLH
jgi:hypothetical protein